MSHSPYRERKCPEFGHCLTLGLQRGVNTLSAVRPLGWGFWRQVTLKRKIFENLFRWFARGHGFTYRSQIWWKSAVGKSSGFNDKKKLRLRGTRRAAISSHRSDRTINFLNVVAPRPVHRYRILSGSFAVCRNYYRTIDFSDNQSHYKAESLYGFQPTIVWHLTM